MPIPTLEPVPELSPEPIPEMTQKPTAEIASEAVPDPTGTEVPEEILTLVNQIRLQSGLPALTNKGTQRAAPDKMPKTGKWKGEPFDRLPCLLINTVLKLRIQIPFVLF